ncbi:MAG: DUF5063 domain-containing protein [Gemmatimonadales bacterium]|nr:DUF5063 domain-containing protein [Gemmatimonadales bacterium]
MDTAGNELPAESFAKVAREWCTLFQARSGMTAAEFLLRTQGMLARLHAASVGVLHVDRETDPETTLEFLASATEAHLDRVQWAEGKTVPADRTHLAMSHAEWVTLYQELSALFGGADRHWIIGEPLAPEVPPPESSSLADELIDIYRDVRYGLQMWERGDEASRGEAVHLWQLTFVHHWGAHVLDALRALHAMTTLPPDERLEEDGGT